ncbi:hypothetical protein GXM_10297 [Nostoc sphaeroides CCNUC1]|uniref:Uncharacterized protein n=1 Tax=Nostoc sphaeroides CCNUC1 TaxID=2653204 RepID=A0A5P8WJC5_9NOSO|nr:hypothetical protein GXM_10297 [Nostoc sphaeroides CCNUC1]
MPPIQLFVKAFTGYEIVNTPALPLGWVKVKGVRTIPFPFALSPLSLLIYPLLCAVEM